MGLRNDEESGYDKDFGFWVMMGFEEDMGFGFRSIRMFGLPNQFFLYVFLG